MKNKKIFLVSALCLLGASAFAITTLNTGDLLHSVLGTNGTQLWNHYSGVAATFDSNGIKEYWVSCSDPAHTIQFTAPTGDVEITDKGAPSAEFINGLGAGDERLLTKLPRSFSFEDGQIPSYITVNKGTATVVTDTATQGSKALQVVATDGINLSISRDWLDAAFTTEGADTVWFDIKASTFAHDLYYNSLTNQWGVVRYEPEVKGGVQTYWHTVAFTKTMFADLKADNTVIRVDGASGITFYIDNIRFGKDEGVQSFEHTAIKSDTLISGDNHVVDLSTNQTELLVNTTSLTTLEVTDAKATDGASSVHIVTTPNAALNVYAPHSLYEQAVAEGVGILFDVYYTGITSAFHIYPNDNILPHAYVNDSNNNGKWTTHYIKPNGLIGDWGWTRLIGTRSANGTFDIYIDNIRLGGEDDVIGFEGGDLTGEAYQILPDTRNTYTVTDEIAYRSSYSLKIEVPGEHYMTFKISTEMYNRIPDNGFISFYAYTDTAFNCSCWHLWSVNTWTLIKVAKADLKENGGAYYVGTIYVPMTFYIDDIRILGPEATVEAVNPNVMAQPADATWYA